MQGSSLMNNVPVWPNNGKSVEWHSSENRWFICKFKQIQDINKSKMLALRIIRVAFNIYKKTGQN